MTPLHPEVIGWRFTVLTVAAERGLDLSDHADGLAAGAMFVGRARAAGHLGSRLEEMVATMFRRFGLELREVLARGPRGVA